MTEVVMLCWLYGSVPNETLNTGKEKQLRKAGREAHLHMAHGVLKENQVHYCVDLIVVFQGFHQRLSQGFP